MKNKKMVFGILFVVLIIIIAIMSYIWHENSDAKKIKIGQEKFGNEKCSRISNSYNSINGDLEHPLIGGTAITEWKCEICGKQGHSTTTNTPKLCEECAKITNRCEICGKLLK